MSVFDCDIAVLGAGAAGLAAAAELSGSGAAVLVLEARDRLGGRILTQRVPGTPLPLELGAEFIHGRPTSTLHWLKRGNIADADANRERWSVQNGKLLPAQDLFAALKKGLERVRKPRADLPFAEFLARESRHLRPSVREFGRMLVEGFDAADAQRVSTLATLEEWIGGGAADAPTSRPVGGYDQLIDTLHGALDPANVTLRLDAPVRSVTWRGGAAEIVVQRAGVVRQIRARKVIVTLPLGVLQQPAGAANAVQFSPPLRSKRAALAGLGAGPVIKAVLQFERAFWETLDEGRYRDVAFFQAPGAGFRTFWSALPMRAPVLVAWAGGPMASRLSGKPKSEVVAQALASMQRLFPRERRLQQLLQSAHVHDWQSDPWARGAYSYVLAGGQKARAQLARPLRGTLFFAGEACDEDSGATVAGALRSGRRAARQALAA